MKFHAPMDEVAFCCLIVFLALTALTSAVRADETTPAKQINPAEPIELRAGDIRLKFQDGQLRYLRVGDREIARRVYFAVRDGNWATIPPRFVQASIRQTSDSFEINLSAECRRQPVDFSWTGRITGTPDGKITFHAEGLPGADFQSNRIGLCVLYGVQSLAEQSFETFESADASGMPTHGRFPSLVSPGLVAQQFRLLRYTSPEGYAYSGSLEGAIFDMEDQRNWGDSSFKAYAPLPYAYPAVKKDQKLAQTVTITAGLEKYADAEVVHLRLGDAIPGAKVPKVVSDGKSFEKSPSFVDVNRGREKYAGATAVTWSYTSATHLPDDDTQMENPPALLYQARTIRSFVPKASLRVGPISLEQTRPGQNPSTVEPFAAAWSAEVLKALSTAGVDEAYFNLAPGAAAATLADVASHEGKPVLSVEAVHERGSARQAWAVQGLAVKDGDATIVWLINRTPQKAQAEVEGVGPSAKVTQLNAAAGSSGNGAANGTMFRIELEPYGVYRVEPKQ